MTMKRSLSTLCVMACVVIFTSSSLGRALAVDSDSLLAEIHVDELVAAEDQPIQVVVCITNAGRRSFEDLTSLYPSDRLLQLRLLREGRLGYLPMGGLIATLINTSAGPSLRPGESVCEVLNLLDWFGSWKRQGHEASWAVGQLSLMPGRYRLSVHYVARTERVGVRPAYSVSSPEVEFEIRPRSSFPGESQLLERVVADGAFEASDLAGSRERCRKWLPEFYGSRYFFLIYYGAGLETPGLSTDSVLAGLRKSRVNPVRDAAFVGLRCKMEKMPRDRKLAWVGRIGRNESDSLMRKVVETWERRLRDGPKAP